MAAEQETRQFPGAFSLLKPSAKAFMLNFWTFIGLFVVSMVAGSIGNFDSGEMTVLYLLSFLLAIALAPALPIAQLRSAKGDKITVLDAISEGFPYAIKLFALQILTALIVVAGLILLIVPGVIALQRLLLAPYFLLDKDMGVIDALKASAKAGKQHSGAIWGVIGVNVVYVLLMFTIILIPAAIVLLVAYSCAVAIRYYQIQEAV